MKNDLHQAVVWRAQALQGTLENVAWAEHIREDRLRAWSNVLSTLDISDKVYEIMVNYLAWQTNSKWWITMDHDIDQFANGLMILMHKRFPIMADTMAGRFFVSRETEGE